MGRKRTLFRKPKTSLVFWVIGLVALVVLCAVFAFPFLLLLTDNGGVFTLNLSPTDIDLDGDLDVLVHNRRNPGEFEVFAGGTLWINQGGLQGGQAGELEYQRNDIEGGLSSLTAQLDGDGQPDVLIFDGNRLTVGTNQGEELWKEASFFNTSALVAAPVEQRQKFGPASQYATLAVGDINNDGRLDALVLGCCGRAFKVNDEGPDVPNFSWIWFNTTKIGEPVTGYVASLDLLEGTPVGDAVLTDLDEDGDQDLVLLSLQATSGTRSGPAGLLLFNDGTGRFSDSGQRLGDGEATSIAAGDLDNDADPDLLLGNGRGASVWINQGGLQAGQAGRFSVMDDTVNAGQTRRIVLVDLDQDNDLDALVVGKRRAVLWWNDGQARFTRAAQSFPCSERENLTTGDFNGDGWTDVFIAQYDKTALVWFNNGDGTFMSGRR